MLPLPLAECLVEAWTGTPISLAGNNERPALAARAVAWATEGDMADDQQMPTNKLAQVGSAGHCLPCCESLLFLAQCGDSKHGRTVM